MLKKLFVSFMWVFCFAFAAEAQTYSCSHADLSIKIARCVRNGDACTVDMIFTNTGPDDLYFKFPPQNITMYDDMGNIYNYSNASLMTYVGNMDRWANNASTLLPSNVPMKFRISSKKLNEISTSFSRIEIKFGAGTSQYIGTDDRYTLRITNVPISGSGSKMASVATSDSNTTVVEDVESIVNDVSEIVNIFKKKKK